MLILKCAMPKWSDNWQIYIVIACNGDKFAIIESEVFGECRCGAVGQNKCVYFTEASIVEIAHSNSGCSYNSATTVSSIIIN